ncbi:MAG TPA: glutamate dehydrogenase, partial [Myxococcales bacterium]|nr:glutamate dehydrogenase [Myxococcales bacterium]
GHWAGRELERNGVKILALSDVTGAVYNADGLDLKETRKYVLKHGGIKGYPKAEAIDPDDVLTLEADIVVPAAIGGVIDAEVAKNLKCRILAEGANGPVTTEGNEVLLKRQDEIFVIPDILANAGGVTVSYFEWVQGTQNFFWGAKEVNDKLRAIMQKAFKDILQTHVSENMDMRTASMAVGMRKVTDTMKLRGLFP